MPLSDDIRLHAVQLLSREADLPEFEDWLVASTWNVHRDPDPDAAPLAYKIDLLLSELSGGYRDEEDVRASIARLLQDHWGDVAIIEPTTVLASGAGTELVGARG